MQEFVSLQSNEEETVLFPAVDLFFCIFMQPYAFKLKISFHPALILAHYTASV